MVSKIFESLALSTLFMVFGVVVACGLGLKVLRVSCFVIFVVVVGFLVAYHHFDISSI